MDTHKQKYEFFTSQGPLTHESFKDLARLCGYAPTEKQLNCPVPNNYNEFLEIVTTFEKRYNKDDLFEQLVSLCGGNTITKEELLRILYSGDKLADDEIDSFLRLINEESGSYNVKDVLDVLYNEE